MAEESTFNPHLILPVGTQVVTLVEVRGRAGGHVCPRGAVGEITSAPQDNFHSDHARFPDGTEAALRRHEFAVRKHHQAGELLRPEDGLSDFDLYDYLIYSCVVGSRAYGLDEEASDVDRRGIYLPPAEMHWSLYGVPEQLENKSTEECYWELQKFLTLALKANPNVLEQLYSPLVVHTPPGHEELKEIVRGCVTRHHSHHYFGFAETQWKLFEKERPRRVKTLLYVYRVLLTGIHLMRTGEVEANLLRLNEAFRLGHIPELVGRKLEGAEKGVLEGADIEFHAREYQRLRQELEVSYGASSLPEAPSGRERLNDLLARLRLDG